MKYEGQVTRERTILRIGAVCAILGAVVSVASGMGFDNLTNEYGTEQVLRTIGCPSALERALSASGTLRAHRNILWCRIKMRNRA